MRAKRGLDKTHAHLNPLQTEMKAKVERMCAQQSTSDAHFDEKVEPEMLQDISKNSAYTVEFVGSAY